ncbi:response regulator [Metabacillus litoralis]|uniref:response regulator n=1 Tax=Metabacillus litoralis TaxID=152268 RepID=UPI00203D393E|nr:response regulator [Metabacillus litoralis]MCM3655249.1 response regulator [Metabacillus litoralis]
MKVLLVDDEKHVREGIMLLGEWEKFGIETIYEAENGAEAINFIQKFQPEIIFTDMKMPKMDGIQLLEWMKEHYPYCKTVVLTGYDDYHYMRKAIHYGSVDYLLKPIDPEILNTTLEHALAEWKKEEAIRKENKSSSQLINKMKPAYRDRMLTQLMNNESMKENLYEEFGFQVSQSYTVALVKVSGKTIGEFHGDRNLAYFTILNVINEILTENECGTGFRYLSNKGEIIIIFWKKIEQIEELLKSMYKQLRKTFNISCPIALGESVNKISELLESYSRAKHVILNSNILDEKGERVYLQEIKSETALPNLMGYASEIELAVQAGEIGAFEEMIERVTKELKESRFLSLKLLLNFEKEYQVICNRWLKKYQLSFSVVEKVEKQIDPYFDQNGSFQFEKYIERKKREISLFLKKVKRGSGKKNTNIIYEIETYLQENCNRDVKLQEIAEQFYLSREYISRKFKQEFNVNISDYVVKIRMNKAKTLLKNSQLKIYEIAEMIGYQDDKYFRKVFKRIEGVTPNEYRTSC